MFLDDQQELVGTADKAIAQREREITQIAKSINSLAVIFKDMQTMVVEQGTVLDRIDYNVEQTATNIEAAVEELEKVRLSSKTVGPSSANIRFVQQGAKYQTGSRNKMLIICLLIGIAICVLIIVG